MAIWTHNDTQEYMKRYSEYENIIIPNDIITIDQNAFSGCDKLDYIFIPESVTCISSHAFSNCKSLKYIVMSQKLTSIGEYCFEYCNQIESIDLPDTIEYIGDGAFFHCESLKSINIPKNVNHIRESLFFGCRSLETINLHENIIKIDESAFYACRSIKKIKLPSNLEYVGRNAFMECTLLTEINVPKCVSNITDIVELVDQWSDPSNLEIITFEEGRTKILKCEFKKSSIKTIQLCESLLHIEKEAFSGCTNLNLIVIPKNVCEIGEYAFFNCNKLQNVIFEGEQINKIENNVFDRCVSLEEITIPNSVTHICNDAFVFCKMMSQIIFSNKLEYIGKCAFQNCDIIKVKLPNTLNYIDQSAFAQNDKLTSIDMENTSIETIDKHTFNKCQKLKKVKFPSTLKSIKSYAFASCTSLESIKLPKNLNTIEMYAFSNCILLEKCYAINKQINIDNLAFDNCKKLRYVKFKPNQIIYNSQETKLMDNSCAICYCDFVDGDTIFVTCNNYHIFHKSCINDWYKIKNECPICRKPAELTKIKLKTYEKSKKIIYRT